MAQSGVLQSPTRYIPAVLLGLATIGAYGTVYYAIGVLIPVIHASTGWSTGVLSAGYSLGLLGQGAIALAAGRIFDRRGSSEVMLASLAAGSFLIVLASFAVEAWQFVLAWALGGAIVGGGLFYNLTMPIASRLYPLERAKALSILTLLGALASPIFYPLSGWLIDLWGWRGAIQALVVAMVFLVAPAALIVRAPGAALNAQVRSTSLRDSLANPATLRLFLVLFVVGIASSSFVLQQVPAMQAAGLSLTTAAAFAGIRGAFQIPGRLILAPLTRRLGVRGTIGVCYAVAATSAFALVVAIAGITPYLLAAYFCVAGGISLGLLSPLNGLFQAEVFGDERLGTLSGIAVVVASIAGALGGFLSGLLVDLSGSYQATLGLAVLLYGLAIAGLIWQAGAQRDPETPTAVIAEATDQAIAR